MGACCSDETVISTALSPEPVMMIHISPHGIKEHYGQGSKTPEIKKINEDFGKGFCVTYYKGDIIITGGKNYPSKSWRWNGYSMES